MQKVRKFKSKNYKLATVEIAGGEKDTAGEQEDGKAGTISRNV